MSYYGINNNTIRFVGLSSGIDVDSIVSSLMDAEQLKVDAINQKKTLVEWKRDAYKEINTMVSDFITKYFSASSPDTSINLSSAFSPKKVAMASSQSVSVTAGSTALEGSYTINSITSIAAGAKTASTAGVSADSANKISTSTALKDLNLGTALTFVTGTDTEGNTVNTLSFNINGTDFSFKDTDTLQTVINTVNRSEAGVTMSYSSLSDKLTVSSKTLGTASEISITNTSGNFFAANSADSAFGIATGMVQNGTDAVLQINGNNVVETSNTFTIDGLTYNLTGTSDTETTFTVSADINSAYSKIKGFIDGYNELIASLNSKFSEEKFRDYPPLTDAQKDEMSEKEIEEWEKKAKSGLVEGDNNIRKLLSDIRNAFSQKVEGAGITFAEIGITTGTWSEKGKLYINESKLKEALANNAEEVTSLFLKTSASTDKTVNYSESGLVSRISGSIKGYTKLINDTTLDSLTDKLTDYKDKVKEALSDMNEKEDYYYKRYAALEKSLSEMNSQTSYFSSLLGG